MIEIIYVERAKTDDATWSCWLSITQDTESWMLPTTAPGDLIEEELQDYFEAREEELWQAAQEKQYPHDFYDCIPAEQTLKAVALITLDEVNTLRNIANLPLRTVEQLINAVKEKLKQL